MRGDGSRCFVTEVFRGLDGSRVVNFLDDQRQSLAREPQGFLQPKQFKVRVRHPCRSPLHPVIQAMREGLRGCAHIKRTHREHGFALDSRPKADETRRITGHLHRPPWLRDERAPAPAGMQAELPLLTKPFRQSHLAASLAALLQRAAK